MKIFARIRARYSDWRRERTIQRLANMALFSRAHGNERAMLLYARAMRDEQAQRSAAQLARMARRRPSIVTLTPKG